MKIFILISVVCSVKAQNSFELQYIGDSLSIEEATNRELCETKYCLADAKYLFSAATQNKSVRPCNDFQEFALGNFIKYESVNDRFQMAGFIKDFVSNFNQKVRKVIAEPVNVNDSHISREIKKFFAKCVNSKYINKNGVREAREYAHSIGLKFYPESNDNDFDLKNYIELHWDSLPVLFFIDLGYFDDDKPTDLVTRPSDELQLFEQQLEDYESILYDMNHIYLNSSYSNEFRKDFNKIKDKQLDFFRRLKNVSLTDEDKNSTKLMTIEELNNLTSPLNLNWLTIINNLLITTKVNSSRQIFVSRPQSISKIAEFLAETEKNIIADYLTVDFLTIVHMTYQVYIEAKYRMTIQLTKRPPERWQQCLSFISIHLPFTLDVALWQQNSDKDSEDSLRQLVKETIDFALEKLKVENCWEEKVLEDVTKRLQSMKVIIGFNDEFVGQDLIEELYSILDFDQNFIKVQHEIYLLNRKQKREQKTIKLFKLAENPLNFKYMPNDNILFIDGWFLNYPFYHKHRPRFFNTATVSSFIFKSLANDLSKYLKDKYKIQDFSIFEEHLQLSFEFYESWLKSGRKELNIGANRLTNEQLYWIVVARTSYRKYQSGFEVPKELDYLNHFNKFISSNPGFKKAFNCKNVNQ